ncbi:RNA dependent RNA polymerase-domain-containing protein [Epithele typhae]|uniref:RNA dependent RNA polymerase-domain-containing protein n=1 Tax=Epithele typhae TaxID=378194 RepID=UPI00200849F6|nr:RNA dependent RNA polymerase-domain-containing protein [Epithele typhae]KAH9944464.1 RNA dependent RNA polymerase-domain-containing protein [Epithele typhae]
MADTGMEIFIRNIPESVSVNHLTLELATILHGPLFHGLAAPRFNFEIRFIQPRKKGPCRIGTLTLPSLEVGHRFLEVYGQLPRRQLVVNNNRILFSLSNKPARPEVVDRIRRIPYEDPRAAYDREQRNTELQALEVHIDVIQFGWFCVDHVYSVEWERPCRASLEFDADRREFRIKESATELFGSSRIIAIRANQTYWVSAGVHQPSGRPVIMFSLMHPPTFESESAVNAIVSILGGGQPPKRQRLTAFDADHEDIAPYTSSAIRLQCESVEDLKNFCTFAKAAHAQVVDSPYPIERRNLFSQELRDQYRTWVLPWLVAFQVEALLRSWLVSLADLMALRPSIDRLLRRKGPEEGPEYMAALLQDFKGRAKALYWYGEDRDASTNIPQRGSSNEVTSIPDLFRRVSSTFVHRPLQNPTAVEDPTAPFQCLRVIITPTTMILDGPFPERSNRIIRTYTKNQDSFLRVSFQDENRLQFRFDREVDGPAFINRRIKRVLLDGLNIVGRFPFRFLAYSQSSLKEHAVWFVKPFRHRTPTGQTIIVDAETIIASIGNFRDLPFDPNLIRCPARYAARISQAFTATDASVEVPVTQVTRGPDVKDATNQYTFTDGVGTISPELAKAIWATLQGRRRRGRKDRTYPRAYQVRFQGSKGMLSVDYTQQGMSILLRPSMIKFEAPPGSGIIEIARAFDKPGPYILNRPLITLLEGLGVPYTVFESLQDDAEASAKGSIESLERSARLLESHGLGTSFRLVSTMVNLHKLGVQPPHDDFWRQMMDFAINHVLRELKHHARIPVPGSDCWTLVGVADVYGYLREGEVFACVDSPHESGLIYLSGDILVSRSPTIHPGDVQVVRAIGRPPPNSPFAREPLRNTVVFSIRGGGDLDGDVYNVTTRHDLLPQSSYPPATYAPADKKYVDHDSTMEDVAEFVAEYISSDTLGIIAITWLIIADQSSEGIFDKDCLTLSELHSDAVDYPKSGQRVPLEKIPKLKYKQKPDWNAPETLRKENESYYPSSRAIGKLFRRIDLPAVAVVQHTRRDQRRRLQRHDEVETFSQETLQMVYEDSDVDEVEVAVRQRVDEFIYTEDRDDAAVEDIWKLYVSFTSQLRTICADHTLSNDRSRMLTEEEAAVGTIVAKSQRDLFSAAVESDYEAWTKTLPWKVVFHIEAILRQWLANMVELLSLRRSIDQILRQHGRDYTAALLRSFVPKLTTLFNYGGEPSNPDTGSRRRGPQADNVVFKLFAEHHATFVHGSLDSILEVDDPFAPFNCLRMTITPTTTHLSGPFPEQSNRVMRTYRRNQDSFVRVSFRDEDRLQYRFNSDVDGSELIDRRVRDIMVDGFEVAGAHFEFLAYSQSALKEHAVWFVKTFKHVDASGRVHFVNADTIIASLGNFRNLSFDPHLMRCPARYAARISQAFTATDAAMSIGVGQTMVARDIKDPTGEYTFTDGVGNMSPRLADEIWAQLQMRRRQGRRGKLPPRAYQIRFQGSKGMLSVDYRLPDRAIVIRPSMIKFEDNLSLDIEIARAFDKPTRFYLNRPLIMLLEGVGVPYEVFRDLQDDAVREAQRATISLQASAKLLEAHGLGTAFRLTSTMLSLHKLGLQPPKDDIFWRHMMDFAINHVLRELKHQARIPVPGDDSWALVGVADVHHYLHEGQVVPAVTFGLGGGDLDGDLYLVTSRAELLPQESEVWSAAAYKAAPRKMLPYESTMVDVADFVAEYIISDTVGIIATNWLSFADQEPDGIESTECLALAELHSLAVDYPKSGQPVPTSRIPQPPRDFKPDWSAPETSGATGPRYYESDKAIGKLFRRIDLPALRTVRTAVNYQQRHMGHGTDEQRIRVLGEYQNYRSPGTALWKAVQGKVSQLINPHHCHYDEVFALWELYRSYVTALHNICMENTLSLASDAMLAEEEVMIGTIVAQTAVRKRRKDLMSHIREQTSNIVASIRGEIEGRSDLTAEQSLQRAWCAYRLATMEGDVFGARSFSWIALNCVFEAIKEAEGEVGAVYSGIVTVL